MTALWTHFALNLVQVAFLLIFAPLVEGVLHRLEEIIEGKRGPSIWQIYRDIWKLFGKDEVVSEESTWVFRFAPIVAFVMPMFVVLLIPALTAYPLFFAFMGDMVAVGFLMAVSGFFVALAGMDTGNVYAAVGASRTHMVGFLAEPVFIMVFFSVSYIANSTIPYFVNATWGASWGSMLQPSHLLVILAFFLLILADEGRIPVDSAAGKVEIAMIGHSKGLEYSGTSAALIKWGGTTKLMVLAMIFVNVLVTPWGLAQGTQWTAILAAIGLVLIKLLAFVIVLAFIETTLAKLRLFRISEFLSVAFVICLFAVSVRLVGIG
ncbi:MULTISPECIES: respiratory chain complex I subunit 1 family protein [Acidithiobacillus]|jgi:Formate hydrogenlyase subunit 4|uniref:Formate hydrogenlyase subunit 4 n=2 Tax=Acidithiobacillus TaxID=119977 RepID=A0A179B827_ACIFR|nr:MULTISPECIES: NADH-quinone oxidoreductase subunit H [Acidithiobacillus]MDA8114740.1 NADH-quinone oxidoreductase subunit H [Acidithiobacillus sp.]MDA8181410.1 NADH-quinone oxidoreductase subunit H [Acidithiobacillus sp.]MEB8486991.1 NADH-quinone oxidoreductase subunit H [Acidithiobacillus ferriphilus]MEB8488540.1 NADH-quinone oxidoreductase subunit H [Acidithiobacillus ferriphilus]MEB8492339.1 NADH-quinone oxidoreductase subunit H [Acidithiobacillus ferriphilus]